MLKLINECYCSPLKVFPNTWDSTKASTKKDWYIYYRFHDPLFKDNPKYKKGKLIVLKGMNHFKDVPARQKETEHLIKAESAWSLEMQVQLFF